jgi:phosphinothricin acetyltransferase
VPTVPSGWSADRRDSQGADLIHIHAIYAHHVLHGLASFEEVAPSLDEMAARRRDVLVKGLPHVVAKVDGVVLGYAYANHYRPRSAYRFTLEDSVYIGKDAIGRGIGRQLLAHIIERCGSLGYRQMIAVIGDSGHKPSIGLHEQAGFRRIGILPSVGFKFDRWVDSVLMQRPLGLGDAAAPVEIRKP